MDWQKGVGDGMEEGEGGGGERERAEGEKERAMGK